MSTVYWEPFVQSLPSLGFTVLFTETFVCEGPKNCTAICAYDPKRGAFLWADSYPFLNGAHVVNDGRVYFIMKNATNHAPGHSRNPRKDGSVEFSVTLGTKDLRPILAESDALGEYLTPWPRRHCDLWLVTHGEHSSGNYDSHTNRRLSRLPPDVRALFCV